MTRLRLFLLPLIALATAAVLLIVPPADARRYPAEFRWRTFESGNINVYYPAGYESFARMIAAHGHTYLDTLHGWYGHPTEIARIVLNPAMDQSHAMAVINPTRVELPLAPALDKGLRPQQSLYLDRVTGHELTHVYQMNQVKGLTSVLRPVFGEAIAPAALVPDWLLEGMAIWTESSGGGGRLHSSYASMLFRTELAQGGAVWPLDRLAVHGRVNPPLNRAYVGGAFLYGSLGTEFRSYRHLSEWIDKMAAWPGLPGWMFRSAYNDRTLDDQYTALESAWRRQLRARIQQRYSMGYASGETLLDRPRTSYNHPEWTPDGELMVSETSYDDVQRILRLYGPLKGRVTEYADRGSSSHDGIAPVFDGVIVSETRRGTLAPESTELMLVRLTRDGRVIDLREGGLNGWAPAFHSDSQQLAWIAPIDEGGLGLWTGEVSMTGRLSSEPRLLVSTRLGHLSDPAWNASGTRLAFTADLGDGERIMVLDLDSDELTRLSIDEARAVWDPCFAGDDTIWLSADQYGIFDLFAVNLADSSALRQSRVITGALEPAVDPKGTRVAYAHYTREGFHLALLDSSRWLREPAGVTVEAISMQQFAAPDSLLETEIFGNEGGYSVLEHLAPNYAVPSYRGGDEAAVGLSVHGRDPVGLLSWRLTGRWGIDSNMPDLGASVTWRDLPVDVTVSASSYPDLMLEADRIEQRISSGANPDTSLIVVYDEEFRRSTDLSAIAYQPMYFDKGPYRTAFTPFAGIAGRFRRTQDFHGPVIDALKRGAGLDEVNELIDESIRTAEMVGVRLGARFSRANSSPRAATTLHLLSAYVTAERAMPGMDLYADLVELGGRWHTPAPWTNTVFAVTGALQAQNGDFAYGRSSVRPRGYNDADLSIPLRRQGRFLFGGVEFHTPIAFVDRGWPSLGTLFLERITGTLFAEATTGWGGGQSLEWWAREEAAVSLGGEIGFDGWLWYQAQTRIELGVAYRPQFEDTAFYLDVSFPELYSFVNDVWDGSRSRRGR